VLAVLVCGQSGLVLFVVASVLFRKNGYSGVDQSVHNGIYLNVSGQSVFMESDKLYLNRDKKSEAYAHLMGVMQKAFS